MTVDLHSQNSILTTHSKFVNKWQNVIDCISV